MCPWEEGARVPCVALLTFAALIAAPSPTCSPSSPFHRGHPVISHSSSLTGRIWAGSAVLYTLMSCYNLSWQAPPPCDPLHSAHPNPLLSHVFGGNCSDPRPLSLGVCSSDKAKRTHLPFGTFSIALFLLSPSLKEVQGGRFVIQLKFTLNFLTSSPKG